MARTKQTARRSTGGMAPAASPGAGGDAAAAAPAYPPVAQLFGLASGAAASASAAGAQAGPFRAAKFGFGNAAMAAGAAAPAVPATGRAELRSVPAALPLAEMSAAVQVECDFHLPPLHAEHAEGAHLFVGGDEAAKRAPSTVPKLVALAAAALGDAVRRDPLLLDEVLAKLPAGEVQRHFLRHCPLEAVETYRFSEGERPHAAALGAAHDDTIKMQEDYYRTLFARNRNNMLLADPSRGVIDVFANSELFQYYNEPGDAALPTLLGGERIVRTGPAIVSHSEFLANFEAFTHGMLNGLDWSHLCVAGGGVLACLLPGDNVRDGIGPYRGADIDLFVHGLPEERADEQIRHVYDVLARNARQKSTKIEALRTQHAITFVFSYPLRHLQIVLRLYRTPAEVIMGFDVDACAVCFDGTRVWSVPRNRRAIVRQLNFVDMSRRSLTYEERLHKYASRGFAVVVPGLDVARINPAVFKRKGANGLSVLLQRDFEAAQAKPPEQEGRNRYRMRSTSRLPEDDFTGQAAHPPGDYAPFIPFGPRWPAPSIRSFLLAKEHSQFFVDLFAAKNSGAKVPHKHMVVTGIDSLLSGAASWCWYCQRRQGEQPRRSARYSWRAARQPAAAPEDESNVDDVAMDEHRYYIHGPIRWLTQDPGRQLLSGSFHPVADDEWGRDVYLPHALVAANALCAHALLNRVAECEAALDRDSSLLCAADSAFGRTPLHWAAIGNALDVVRLLLARGVSSAQGLDAGDVAGCTALHYAAMYDHGEIAERLLSAGAALRCSYAQLMSPVHVAASFDAAEVLALLLSRFPDAVNEVATCHRSPLFYAVFGACKEAVRLLLARGANPQVAALMQQASSGFGWGAPQPRLLLVQSVQELARNSGQDEVAKLLPEYDAAAALALFPDDVRQQLDAQAQAQQAAGKNAAPKAAAFGFGGAAPANVFGGGFNFGAPAAAPAAAANAVASATLAASGAYTAAFSSFGGVPSALASKLQQMTVKDNDDDDDDDDGASSEGDDDDEYDEEESESEDDESWEDAGDDDGEDDDGEDDDDDDDDEDDEDEDGDGPKKAVGRYQLSSSTAMLAARKAPEGAEAGPATPVDVAETELPRVRNTGSMARVASRAAAQFLSPAFPEWLWSPYDNVSSVMASVLAHNQGQQAFGYRRRRGRRFGGAADADGGAPKNASAPPRAIMHVLQSENASSSSEAELRRLVAEDGVNVRNSFGVTLLHAAVMAEANNWFGTVLGLGPALDERDFAGQTALHYAVELANMLAVERLVAAGADVNAIDCFGRTPLVRALECTICAQPEVDATQPRSQDALVAVRSAIIIARFLRKHGAAEPKHVPLFPSAYGSRPRKLRPSVAGDAFLPVDSKPVLPMTPLSGPAADASALPTIDFGSFQRIEAQLRVKELERELLGARNALQSLTLGSDQRAPPSRISVPLAKPSN